MIKKTHGGKRFNAGRLPQFVKKDQEWKAIYIRVPKDKHEELTKICKAEIKRCLEKSELKNMRVADVIKNEVAVCSFCGKSECGH